MDYRLILSVLLVTLSWRFMGAYAQVNSTATPAAVVANASSAVPSVNPVVSNASNLPATNASAGANGTSVAPAGANGTTVAGNISTTAAATTTATIPVAPLTVPITMTDCGSKKLCVAEPKTCDPSTGNQCYFISATQQSGQLFGFELSGQTAGYIAAGLSTSSNQADSHQAYICANNNGAVKFFTGTITNFMVNLTSLDSSNVTGSISSNKIQCTFSATVPNTTTRAAGLSLSVSTGTYDPATGKFGQSNFKIQTPVVNLSNPNTTISNLVNTNSTNSTSGAFPTAHQQSLMMPALLLIVTILAFTTQ